MSRAITDQWVDHDVIQLSNVNCNSFGLTMIKKKEIEKNPGLMRHALAKGFGLTNEKESNLRVILEQLGYALTSDFAVKILMLHERNIVGENVILQGHTGTGKSELLRLYAHIQNQRGDIIPDVGFELYDWLSKSDYVTRSEHLKNDLEQFYSTRCPQDFINLVSRFCKHEQDMNEDFLPKFGADLVKAVQNRIFTPKYNLLQQTDHIKSMIEIVQANETKKITIAHITKLLEDTFNTRPHGIFYKLMMHSGIYFEI